MNEKYTFPLANENITQWTPVQFAVADPYHHNKEQADIVLVVDWQNRFSFVETQNDNGSMTDREFHSLEESFGLPSDLDATKFLEYYFLHIRPLLQKRAVGYKVNWDGFNLIGDFKAESDCTESLEIANVCIDAPTHNLKIFCSLAAAFSEYSDIEKIFSDRGVSFTDVIITDDVVKKFRAICDEYYFIGNIQPELLGIQEYLKES